MFILILLVIFFLLFVAWLVKLIISKDVVGFLIQSVSIVAKVIAFIILATIILFLIFLLLL